jgi:hypothetical protein
MARLVGAESVTGSLSYFINVDRVSYVQQSKTNPEHCTVYFDKDQSLTIGMSAQNFSDLALSR